MTDAIPGARAGRRSR